MRPEKNSDKSLKSLFFALGAVFQTISLGLAAFFVGYIADHYIVSTKPWLTVVCAFLGVFLGFKRLYDLYKSNSDFE